MSDETIYLAVVNLYGWLRYLERRLTHSVFIKGLELGSKDGRCAWRANEKYEGAQVKLTYLMVLAHFEIVVSWKGLSRTVTVIAKFTVLLNACTCKNIILF